MFLNKQEKKEEKNEESLTQYNALSQGNMSQCNMSQGNMSMVYKLQGKASQSKMPKSVKSAEYFF